MKTLRLTLLLCLIVAAAGTAFGVEQAGRGAARQLAEKGAALYQEGKKAEALDAFSQAIGMQGDYAPAVYGKAAILFVDGKFRESQAVLQAYLNKAMTDPFAWIWAYVSMSRHSPQDRAMLTDVLALTDINTWTNDTIQMLLGQMTAEQYIENVKHAEPPAGGTRDAQLCRSYWTAGEAKLIAGDKEAAAKWLEMAANCPGPFQWEREMAKAELARVRGGAATQPQ